MTIAYTWKPIEEIRHRMDPAFWDPHCTALLDELQDSGFPIQRLAEYVVHITNGSRDRVVYQPEGVMYIKAVDVWPTGIVYPNLQYIKDGSPLDPARCRLEVNDLMIVRSGKGSIGKVAVWHKDLGKATASQHVNLVRVRGINPFWIVAFLKSKYGQTQIERLETGVSRMTHLTYDDIRRFLIPVVPDKVQISTERRYNHMLQFHDAAMEAKAMGNQAEFQEKLTYAEQLLNELIGYVESIMKAGPQALAPEKM